MAKKQLSTAEKLKALYDLQNIDSKIDKLHVLKGELPLEVDELEAELDAITQKVEHIEQEKVELKENLVAHEVAMKNSTALIERYEKQLESVKNNREFEALSKEVRMQKLEIQLSEKKLKQTSVKLESKEAYLGDMQENKSLQKEVLEKKKAELEEISKETEIEEEKLNKRSERAKKKVDEYLLTAYERIRKNYKNGLAVVSIERDSCGGCHIGVPPQLQIEIDDELKIIPCENCGRIFVPDYTARKAAERAAAKE